MTAVLERLAPVALDQLVDEAALQTRIDRKYLLPAAEAEFALAGLPDGARALEIDGERAFRYESHYFDTPDLLSYRMAAHGRRRRFKLRTRRYVDSELGFLEVKVRGARGTTVKDRIPHEGESLDDARDYVDDALGAIGLPAAELELRPTLATRYRRATLLLPDGSGRATIDTELEWQLESGERLVTPGLVIVETKSPSRPSPVDRLLWRAGHRPATISKYGTGLAALRGLPANKWHRVLRRYFDPARRPGERSQP